MHRIAMLSYHTCPLATLGGKDTGGMNVYVRDLTRELGRQGIHVDVFTRSQDEHVPHILHDLGYGNRVVHVPAGPEVPLPKNELASFIPRFAQEIKNFAEDKLIVYDLIHSHYWMSGIAAQPLSSAWNVPVVHMFHTLGEMKNRIARSDEEKDSPERIAGERSVLSSSTRIVAATIAEQAQLQWLYQADPKKTIVIPPGVDTGHFYPIPADEARAFLGLNPRQRVILFVGRIEPLKGIDTLIKAMPCLRVAEADRPASLVIIGGEPDVSPDQMTAEMSRLKALCKELALDDLVIFLGKRDQDTLPYYYSAADVVVMPSHYESFGMVALEAMACGTPVVASQVGGLAFLVQDGVTGFHVPDQDPDALCDRLSRLLSDSDLLERMGEQAAEYAKGYAWEMIAQQMIHLYQSLV